MRLHGNPSQAGAGVLLAQLPAGSPQAGYSGIWSPTGGDVFVVVVERPSPAPATLYRIGRGTGAIEVAQTWSADAISSSTMSISDDRKYFTIGVDNNGLLCSERLYRYPSWQLLEELPRGCNFPDIGQRFAPATRRSE